MGFLNRSKKRDEPLARLSEKEIQQKLYGGFHAGAEGLTSAPKPFARHEPQPKAASPRPAINAVAPSNPDSDEDLFTQTRFARETTPSQAPSEKKSEEAPLDTPKVPPIHASLRPGTVRPDSGSFRSAASKAGEPTRMAKKPVYKAPSLKLPKLTLPNLGKPLSKLFSVLIPGIRAVASALLNVLIQMTKWLAEFVYYRRESVKKVSLWGLAILGVFALFIGVHMLNVRREEAMQKPPVQRVQEAPAPAAPVVAEEPSSPLAEPTPAIPAEAPAVESEGKYVVQIATYFSETDATKVAGELKAGNWPSFIRNVPRSDGKVFYSVYLGRFQDYQQAQDVLNKFRKTAVAGPFQDAFIRKLKE